jgi:DnaK suppressor protein
MRDVAKYYISYYNTIMDQNTIQELKAELLREQEHIQKELERVATKSSHNTWTTKFPKFEESDHESDGDMEESADEVEEYEARLATEGGLEERLKDIDAALARITDGTYGISIRTGKPIPIERLRANPAAAEEVKEMQT